MTTGNEGQSLPSELFNNLILVKEKGWGNWFMCDELPRLTSNKLPIASSFGWGRSCYVLTLTVKWNAYDAITTIRGIVTGMITRIWAGQPRNCVSIPGRGQSFLSSPPIIDQQWRQSNLLFSGSGDFFPGVMQPVREADHAPNLVPWKRITGAATPLQL